MSLDEETSTRVAFITGANGQDGSLLSAFLLEKGYHSVVGMIRRTSLIHLPRLDAIRKNPRFKLVYGDMTDAIALEHLILDFIKEFSNAKRFEIYHLAAQSHVLVSFQMPDYTCQVNYAGTQHMLNVLVSLPIEVRSKIRFYFASSTEMFGSSPPPQHESTAFKPQSPYAVSKVAAYYSVVLYREAFGLFACNGILTNHESVYRGPTFVTKKITQDIGSIARNEKQVCILGNLNAKRDWMHGLDAIRAMYLIMQHDTPGDWAVGTGEQHSVREFATLAFEKGLGVRLEWRGKGLDEVGVDSKSGEVRVKVEKKYFRPAEVDSLLVDSSKIRRALGWTPSVSFQEIINEMVQNDLRKNE